MTGNILQIIVSIVVAMSIPSALFGALIRKLERRIISKEDEAATHDKAQKELMLLLVQSTGAAIALGEATAKAVQRIPDAHCNGDMHDALGYATSIKHKQKAFLERQGVDATVD